MGNGRGSNKNEDRVRSTCSPSSPCKKIIFTVIQFECIPFATRVFLDDGADSSREPLIDLLAVKSYHPV